MADGVEALHRSMNSRHHLPVSLHCSVLQTSNKSQSLVPQTYAPDCRRESGHSTPARLVLGPECMCLLL